ncbi:hypothetical protein CDAR_76521 [Caerostris darwini]|uniref:Uncharacterized protein n=1 Tax=Caerostris darwini TaxID=1538125 RepID=A0AAV4QCZ5_9ARAC|nr:hypothetical protein CDAR_76521 [Caerostris darwini]
MPRRRCSLLVRGRKRYLSKCFFVASQMKLDRCERLKKTCPSPPVPPSVSLIAKQQQHRMPNPSSHQNRCGSLERCQQFLISGNKPRDFSKGPRDQGSISGTPLITELAPIFCKRRSPSFSPYAISVSMYQVQSGGHVSPKIEGFKIVLNNNREFLHTVF